MIWKVGDRFGRLTVIQLLPKGPASERMLLCQCDCGTRKSIRASNLRPNQTSGCGCGRKLRWGKPKPPSSVPDAVIAADDGKYPTADERKAARLKTIREVHRRLKALDAQASP
jgi:hypothetical protein